MFFKKIAATILFTASLGAAHQAFAACKDNQLCVTNETSAFSTCRVNGICSSNLGSDGITKPHEVHGVDMYLMKTICMLSPHDCRAEVFMNDNCSGQAIGTVVMDVKEGVKSVSVTSKDYQITATGKFAFLLSSAS